MERLFPHCAFHPLSGPESAKLGEAGDFDCDCDWQMSLTARCDFDERP